MPITHAALGQSRASVSSILAATGTWQGQIMSEAALGKHQGLLRMGIPDLPCNLSPLHVILLTSVCSPGVGTQGEGIGEQECLQGRAKCGADVLGPVWSSLHVAGAGLWLLGWFQASLPGL